jgi:hypothetical protein
MWLLLWAMFLFSVKLSCAVNFRRSVVRLVMWVVIQLRVGLTSIFLVLRRTQISFLVVCILLFLIRGVVCLGCWWSFAFSDVTVILANNIFLLEDGRTTETCSSVSSKINVR